MGKKGIEEPLQKLGLESGKREPKRAPQRQKREGGDGWGSPAHCGNDEASGELAGTESLLGPLMLKVKKRLLNEPLYGAFMAAFMFFILTFPSKVCQQIHSGQQNRQNQNLSLQVLMDISVSTTKAVGEGGGLC